jgi:hypothetical protein
VLSGRDRRPAQPASHCYPAARTDLRNVLIRDDADRDALASILICYRDQHGQGWADIVDLLTMYPEARRRVTRVLGKIEANEE